MNKTFYTYGGFPIMNRKFFVMNVKFFVMKIQYIYILYIYCMTIYVRIGVKVGILLLDIGYCILYFLYVCCIVRFRIYYLLIFIHIFHSCHS